jgi:hypothetical protein
MSGVLGVGDRPGAAGVVAVPGAGGADEQATTSIGAAGVAACSVPGADWGWLCGSGSAGA